MTVTDSSFRRLMTQLQSHPMPFRIAFVLYGLLIIWASLRTGGGPQPIEHFDKIMHLVFYGLYALIAAGCTKQQKTFLHLSLLIIGYGALMEYCQSFVPSRFMSVADIVANTTGVIIVVLTLLKLKIYSSISPRS